MNREQKFPLAASQYNLRRLLSIRFIIFVCQLLALAYVYYFLQLTLDYILLACVLFTLSLINVVTFLRLRKSWEVSDFEFLGHLLVDVIGLSTLLYLCGGANNPFVSYLLVPITISAAILPWVYTWVITAVSLSCYSILLFFYQPLPELMPLDMTMAGSALNLHITGMWFNFLVSAILITYFVVNMAEEIRAKEKRLTRYREANLRDEQILAVATLAAGTAHELGSPLTTIAVLLKDMQKDYTYDQDLQKDITIIKEQIERCKATLKELVNQADFRSSKPKSQVSLILFIEQVLGQWKILRPEVPLTFNVNVVAQLPEPEIRFELTLQQAVINMLNNAADASPEGIDVYLFWQRNNWGVRIRDYGEGISDELAEQLGTRVISSKADGLGVGFILSQASINRQGGHVSIYQHKEKGTITEINLPFKRL